MTRALPRLAVRTTTASSTVLPATSEAFKKSSAPQVVLQCTVMESRGLLSLIAILALSSSSFSLSSTQASVQIGQQAPDFGLEDSTGKSYTLSEFRGDKAVVLEFFRSGDW